MKLLSYVSELLMPFLILYVVGYGLLPEGIFTEILWREQKTD